MSKKMMVLALAVVSAALFALPAVASAQTWHLDTTSSFSISGSGGTLTSSVASLTCSSTTGSGSFSTTTEGTVSVVFHSCKVASFFNCTTPGQSPGTIKLSAKFDGIMLGTNLPGILLTPHTSVEPTPVSAPGWKVFSEFECEGGFGVVKVFGKGSIGTITAPACGTASTTATLAYSSSATGVQQHQSWTGSPFDLKSTISPTSHPTASLDGTATMTFPAARTMTCTHTSVVG